LRIGKLSPHIQAISAIIVRKTALKKRKIAVIELPPQSQFCE
jgi:hypothetical protein